MRDEVYSVTSFFASFVISNITPYEFEIRMVKIFTDICLVTAGEIIQNSYFSYTIVL